MNNKKLILEKRNRFAIGNNNFLLNKAFYLDFRLSMVEIRLRLSSCVHFSVGGRTIQLTFTLALHCENIGKISGIRSLQMTQQLIANAQRGLIHQFQPTTSSADFLKISRK
ncbi:CLUMA_CG019328, isoform A [Clunio marinus]|uniref:CLUMA_CG019328, isoform A n=1 Tax=Clunio marinus TaxID=568069 RepID=A0A1J1J3U6_9DIPT|nr:CLUMA_CG019328, isoform A [Clunio marinus]